MKHKNLIYIGMVLIVLMLAMMSCINIGDWGEGWSSTPSEGVNDITATFGAYMYEEQSKSLTQTAEFYLYTTPVPVTVFP